jgi:DNA polymerase-3 subunit delta
MKASVEDLPRLASRLDKLEAALVHGEDRALVHETAALIARKVAQDLSDPFQVVALDADSLLRDPARLHDELAQLSLTSARRLVWLREASDRHTAMIGETESFADSTAASFLLVEAEALAWRSTLKALFEGSRRAISIACGAGAGLDELVRELAARGFVMDAEARALFSLRVGADHGLARQALEKLALFKGAPGPVTRSDVVQCVEDAEMIAIDDVVETALDGRLAALEHALMAARAAGASSVTLIRAAQRTCQRADLVLRLAESGASFDEAINALRPPPPYSARSAFAARCRSWTIPALADAMTILLDAEVKCKTSAFPDDVIAARALMDLARLRARPEEARR